MEDAVSDCRDDTARGGGQPRLRFDEYLRLAVSESVVQEEQGKDANHLFRQGRLGGRRGKELSEKSDSIRSSVNPKGRQSRIRVELVDDKRRGCTVMGEGGDCVSVRKETRSESGRPSKQFFWRSDWRSIRSSGATVPTDSVWLLSIRSSVK